MFPFADRPESWCVGEETPIKVANADSEPKRMPGSSILFGIGKFRTALCGRMLEMALVDKVTKVLRIQCYEAEPLLQEWGKWAIAARRQIKNSDLAWLAPCLKKIINCLPGKFGQRQRRWLPLAKGKIGKGKRGKVDDKEWRIDWGLHPKEGYLTQYRQLADITEYADQELLMDDSCPIISACWIADGLAFMWGALDFVGERNWFYCNTDSLIVNEEGYQRFLKAGLIHPDEPLKWKVREVADRLIVAGIGRYQFGNRVCISGPFGEEAAFGEKPAVWYEQEKLFAQLCNGNACDPVVVKRVAHLRSIYRHGKVTKDGWIEPFKFDF